ncbi:AraC family transcriptional regulator [uncultured Kordia sp.]|uniref:AraC family transcriptional regulator n=1 Tax=uncultured Kordia sp. TaxID=507699 RepID=UPI00261ED67E|nr:AraC family transcriptional regulator [uncultured Kordia sp.]
MSQYSYEKLTEKFQKVRFTNTQSAKIYLTKIFKIAKAEKDDEKLFFFYRNLAKTEDLTGNTDEAITLINKAISIAKQKLNDKELEADCIFTKAYISYNSGLYEEAFSNYTKAYAYYKNTANKTKENYILINIALLKNILGDQDGAIQLLLKKYKNYKSLSEKDKVLEYGNSYVSILSTLSNAYIRKAIKYPNRKAILLDSASIYNNIGLLETEKTNNISANKFFKADKGIILEERGNISEALKELDASLDSNKSFQQPNLLTAVYYHKGICYKKLNQIDEAILYLKKTDSITEKTRTNYTVLQNAYYGLAKIYIDRKDYANSTKYLQLYIENDLVNDDLTEIVRKQIHELHDIALLKNEIKDLNIEIEDNSFTSIIIIGILVIILCGFFVFYYYQKRKNKVTFQKLIQQLETKKEEKISIQTTSKVVTIDDEKVVQVLKALNKFEEKEWFRNKNCDLAFVAKKAKTNKTYLSKIIHTHKQLKFIDYIRNLRIDYALERLKDDPVFRSYDIKSIAEESGFKSSDMFSRAFVKNTGIYPSYYIKNINKINP